MYVEFGASTLSLSLEGQNRISLETDSVRNYRLRQTERRQRDKGRRC
jgi:hypothetical protein